MSGRRIGNYVISDYLGGGGFGSVFKAEDASGRIVAIKELHKKHTRSPVIKQRFFQEAIAMAKLDHPNLPKLYTFGEDNGSYYLVMEFLSGKPLTEEIHEKTQLPLKQALTIIAQTLEALSYAHQQGIIHRDLKPDNIMLTGDSDNPVVKILDFGIARMLGGENLTMAGEGFGTPVYMSPERIAGSLAPDSRADIYSMGIILYEMLSGQVPFQSKSSDPLIYWAEMRTLHEAHPLPPMNLDDLPEEVERIIKKATAKTVEYRYGTADEMLVDVRALLGSDARVTKAVKNSQLAITTEPPRASVYVDDILRGSSDETTGKFLMEALPPGSHRVRVTKTGYDEYQTHVTLEEDKRADLQVTLSARKTMMAPASVGDNTSPMDYSTARMESGEDEKKTAMLMLEGVPAGSQVFVGAKAMAFADQEGRATLNLLPGVHELEVRTPTGESGKRMVRLTEEDTGAKKTMAIPMTQVFGAQATDERPAPAAPAISSRAAEPSPPKKRAAMIASVAIVAALAASSFFIFKGRTSQPPAPANTQASVNGAASPTGATDAAKTSDDQAAANSDKDKIAALQAELDELKRAQEKSQDKTQDKSKTKPDKATKEQPTDKEPKTPPVNAITPPGPVPPAPAAPQAPSATPNSMSCVAVRVFNPDGQPAAGAKVMFLVMYDIPQKQQRKTTPKGLAGVCDLPVGTKVMVMVAGGGIPQNVVVTPNNQVIAMTLNRPVNPDSDNEPETRNRRNTPPDNTNPTPPMPFRRERNFPMRKQRPPM